LAVHFFYAHPKQIAALCGGLSFFPIIFLFKHFYYEEKISQPKLGWAGNIYVAACPGGERPSQAHEVLAAVRHVSCCATGAKSQRLRHGAQQQ
jgi:hypothetical protein